MRAFSLLFAFISGVLLVQLVAYLVIGPVQTAFVVVLLAGFVACATASLYLLKPFEDGEALQRRRREWRQRRGLDESGDSGSENEHSKGENSNEPPKRRGS